jgi:hypothetical protein
VAEKPEDEDKITVEIEPKTEDEGAATVVAAPEPDPAPAAAAPVVIEPEEGIEALKAKLAASESARISAEARAREHAQAAAGARDTAQDAELALVKGAIERLQQSQDVLEANITAAYTDGDFAAVAKAQREMADNAAKLHTLETGKGQLEARSKEPKIEPLPSDPVEALAVQLSPRSAEWVRLHPEYAREPRLFQKMLAAHNLVVADGIPADTDDYFRSIESTLGIKAPAADPEPVSEAATPTERRAAPASAPVSRGTGSGRTVRLSADEVELAASMGVSAEEWAAQKEAIAKEKVN